MSTYSPRIKGTDLQRFMAKVEKTSICWLWTAAIENTGRFGGYGMFSSAGKTIRAHKWYWEHLNGKVPTGYEIDHKCHSESDCKGGPTCQHRRCVNPDHLELVTHAENARRSAFGGRSWRKELTHCVNGHEFTPENTYLTKHGRSTWRACKACKLQRQRDAYHRKK